VSAVSAVDTAFDVESIGNRYPTARQRVEKRKTFRSPRKQDHVQLSLVSEMRSPTPNDLLSRIVS
jgi:hypothetical protein